MNNKVSQKVIRQLLPNIPIQVFENGEAGLTYLISRQDDNLKTLVFLDLQMPIMTGFEFLSIYENAIAHQNPPFSICLLSSEGEGIKQQCLKRYPSVLDHTNKPLEKACTEQLIARAIARLSPTHAFVSVAH